MQATANKVGRHSTLGKKPTTLRMVAADALWRFVQTGGRVLCIALFASVYDWWVLAILLPHVVLMFAWIFKKAADESPSRRLHHAVLNAFFSVCLFLSIRPSRYWYVVLHVLFVVENLFVLLTWYLNSPDRGAWFHTWGLVGGLLSTPLHVSLQLLYYGCCHPNSDIPHSVPCDRHTWQRELLQRDWKTVVHSYKMNCAPVWISLLTKGATGWYLDKKSARERRHVVVCSAFLLFLLKHKGVN